MAKGPEKQKPLGKRTFNHLKDLECELPMDQQNKYGRMLAAAVDDLHINEVAKRSAAKRFAANEAAFKTEMVRLKKIVSSGKEVRQVPCTTTYDHDKKRMTCTRVDTGIVFENRPMNREELEQLPLSIEIVNG